MNLKINKKCFLKTSLAGFFLLTIFITTNQEAFAEKNILQNYNFQPDLYALYGYSYIIMPQQYPIFDPFEKLITKINESLLPSAYADTFTASANTVQAGNPVGVRTEMGGSSGGTACNTTGIGNVADNFLSNPAANIAIGCKRISAEWNVTAIPDNAVITDVKFKFSINTAVNGRNCDYNQIEHQPSLATVYPDPSVQLNYDDIGNGTTFVSNDSTCATNSVDNILDLGSSADTDLQNNISSGKNWWAIGIKYNDEVRDALTSHSQRIANSFELQVTYTVPATVPDQVTGVTATADIDTVIVDWDPVTSTPPVDKYWIERGNLENTTWQYREHRYYGALSPDFTFNVESLSPNRLQVDSTVGSLGNGYVFKTFKTSEISGKTIKVTWQGTKSGPSNQNAHLFVYDGAYDATNSTDLGTGIFAIKGGGQIGDAFVPLSFAETTTSLLPTWGLSTEPFVTIFITNTDSQADTSELIQIKSLEIVDYATWNFTNPIITVGTSGGEDDKGTVDASSVQNVDFQVIGNTIPPITTFVDTTQNRATTYQYGVFAENLVGNGTTGFSNNVLTNDVPDQVENLIANSILGQINLQWDALAYNSGEGNPSTGLNLTRYDIWRNNVTTGGGFFLLASNFANSPPENFYNDTDVVGGNQYEYQISGCNAIDCGDNSTSTTLFAMSGPPTTVDLTGLKAYYKFDETSGDLINLAGTVGSTVSLGTPANGQLESGIIRGDSGIIGNSYHFPGSATGQITLGTSTSQFNFMHNQTAKWSVNYWSNVTVSTNGAIIQNNVGTTANSGIDIDSIGFGGGSVSAGVFRGVTFASVIGPVNSGAGTVPNNGQWHMVTITYDYLASPPNMNMYVDGVLVKTEPNDGDVPSNSNAAVPMQLGGYGDAIPFTGDLDEMSIWNRVLTPTDVSLLYDGGAGGELGTLTQGTLKITKLTTAANDLFNFTVSGPTSLATSINTIGGTGTFGPNPVTAGTYSVQETVPTGWKLTTATCNDGSSTFSVDIVTGIIIDASDNIECTFTNTPSCNGLPATMVGSENNDVLVGTAANDVIVGRGGNDTIDGKGGNDTICGGNGNDTISGGLANDTIFGDGGIDQLFGNDGSDVIRGGTGIDYIEGGAGTDTIFGEDDHDTIFGQVGVDTIDGGNGNDLISGDAGNDIITGGEGDDTIFGGADADTISANAGDDRLLGEGGNDSLDGGSNQPTGVDICIGGGQGGDTSVNCEVTI